ncbi:MAG: hypothetical protein PHD95_05130, partial [Candidatus ainarchaeum sp.]|nr:hypothetical protein [Candidatus ainarchaeum sp.]
AFFLVPDNTPCGYAQKCHKGICIAYPTTEYQEPIRIFGQPLGIIALLAMIIIICTAMGLYFYKAKKQNNF